MSNLLQVISRFISNPNIQLINRINGRNRINSVGYALENYIKDLFAVTVNETNENIRINKYSATFSYLGNQNNPPDLILRGGDAIEIKKIQSASSSIALNSSYPKAKFYSNSPLITRSCRECETWEEKDILYIIGYCDDTSIIRLWFLYGDCFAASKETYESIRSVIQNGVNSINGVEFAETNELGKIKRVDPLGITDLRIRGMWHVENPSVIFNYLPTITSGVAFQLNVIMKNDKFISFPIEDRNNLLLLTNDNYSIETVSVKNPDNPAQLIACKLITFKIL